VKEARDEEEKAAGTYYEGPEPPSRYAQSVVFFAATHPGATVEEWAAFTLTLAQRCYREGYTRGKEWRERDLDSVMAATEDVAAHDWEWNSPQIPTSEELAARVEGSLLEDMPDEEARVRYLDAIGRLTGTFRVVVSR
jgi:hypothetical protein